MILWGHRSAPRPRSSSRKFFRSAATRFASFCRPSRASRHTVSISKSSASGGAHLERAGGTDSRRAVSVTAAPSTTSGLLLNAEFPYPSVTLSDGRREGRSAGLCSSASVEKPRRSREGDVRVLRRARQFQPDTRFDADRLGPRQPVLREGAQIRHGSRRALDDANIPVSVYRG